MYEYPKEYFIPIENEPNFLGRITINKINKGFSAEIDIVLDESRKIYHHVKILFNKEEENEAIDHAMQVLAKYLRNEK